MAVPTPRDAIGHGRSTLERIELLESRLWTAPDRIAGTIRSSLDANSFSGSGWFWLDSAASANTPKSGVPYLVRQYELSSGSRYQIAERIGTPTNMAFGERWSRVLLSGVWSAWVPLGLDTPYLVTISDANTSVTNEIRWITSGTLNGPPVSGQNYLLETIAVSPTAVYQRATRIGGSQTQFTEVWGRWLQGTTWMPWTATTLSTRSFTPVIASGVTLGNGTLSGRYMVSDGMVHGMITMTLGSTSTIDGDIQFDHPMSYAGGETRSVGSGRLFDASTSMVFSADVLINATRMYLRPQGAAAATSGNIFMREFSANSTTPFTWAAGDSFSATFQYPVF